MLLSSQEKYFQIVQVTAEGTMDLKQSSVR